MVVCLFCKGYGPTRVLPVMTLSCPTRRSPDRPWVNTLAADRHGDARYGDMSRIPNVTDAVATRCAPSATAATAAKQADLTILAGNVARCNWTTRPRVARKSTRLNSSH